MTREDPQLEEVLAAASAGEAGRVLALIDADSRLLNITNSNVESPLTLALEEGHLALAEQLIERGANVFTMSHSDHWPMKLITRRNGLKAADRKRLVEAAIAVPVCDAEVFHAVWRRDRRQTESVLAQHPEQVSARLADPKGESGFYNALPWCGLSPLHYAVMAGDKRMVRLLLEAGAEVDAIPHGQEADSRHTPMMFVPNSCGEIAELLVEHGADVRHSGFYLTSGSRAMRKVILGHGAAGTPFLTAICLRRFDEAIEIARNNPTVVHDRLSEAYIDTPLHLAAKANCRELVEILLDHGMDVDTPASGGDTALTMAAEMYCSFDIFKLLVDRGADIHVDNDEPLHYAIWQHAYRHWDFERVIRFLAGRGARPRGLYHCAIAGNLAAARLVLELGGNVNETGDDCWPGQEKGYTPLDYCTAVSGGQSYPRLAEYLREQGGCHSADLPGKN